MRGSKADGVGLGSAHRRWAPFASDCFLQVFPLSRAGRAWWGEACGVGPRELL